MTLGDVIKEKYFGSQLTPGDLESLTVLKSCIGKESNTLFPAAEDWFSLRAFMELTRWTQYANPAQQIVIEDSATCILKKLLDYANSNVLKNFKLSLQQEQKYYGIKSGSLRNKVIVTNSAGGKIEKSTDNSVETCCTCETCSMRAVV